MGTRLIKVTPETDSSMLLSINQKIQLQASQLIAHIHTLDTEGWVKYQETNYQDLYQCAKVVITT